MQKMEIQKCKYYTHRLKITCVSRYTVMLPLIYAKKSAMDKVDLGEITKAGQTEIINHKS